MIYLFILLDILYEHIIIHVLFFKDPFQYT